jgi:apolipoprotein N-acyltransferase
MLIGAIDLAPVFPGDPKPYPTNSALFFDEHGTLRHKYSKIHRVPFGEYIPFRKYIPKLITEKIDMGRDIVSGADHSPVKLAPGVNAGVAICYEGVFGYITRESALRGANILVVLSNDAWYPASSEPEQHLANAVLRCVETGLPMVRCGNNGGSGVVTNKGIFTRYIGSAAPRPELLREKASGVVTVTVERFPAVTFAVKFENWLIYLLSALLLAETILLCCKKYQRSK